MDGESSTGSFTSGANFFVRLRGGTTFRQPDLLQQYAMPSQDDPASWFCVIELDGKLETTCCLTSKAHGRCAHPQPAWNAAQHSPGEADRAPGKDSRQCSRG